MYRKGHLALENARITALILTETTGYLVEAITPNTQSVKFMIIYFTSVMFMLYRQQPYKINMFLYHQKCCVPLNCAYPIYHFKVFYMCR